MATGEGGGRTPEQLSNRRLLYEAFVHALRRPGTYITDAHQVIGETEHSGGFTISDYLAISLTGSGGQVSEEVTTQFLDQRRPCISIRTSTPDSEGYTVGYTLVYPEDVSEDDFLLAPTLQVLVPEDWPPNEPFIYETRRQSGLHSTPIQYRPISEPFQETRLAEIYSAAVATL